MVALPTADSPLRSRLLTTLGRIVLFIGATAPIRIAWEYFYLNPFLQVSLGSPWRASAILGLVIQVMLGILSVWAGWGILRRRSWAPSVVCCAGGAVLANSLYFLHSWGPPAFRMFLQTMHTKYFVIAIDMGVPVLIEVGVTASWLITLGGVMRRQGRDEFAPVESELPVSSLWASLVLSALVCGGLRAIELAFFVVHYPQ